MSNIHMIPKPAPAPLTTTAAASIEPESMVAGNYDLQKTIGKGHFAVVKLARHAFTGECVAVKIIDKTKLDSISRDHLFQEVMCMKLVQHPHVVRLYEVIDTTHKLYLIQEWGDGGDLYDYIIKHDKGLTESNARKYFNQILNAIAYCHQLHVVHRDLKPENVVFFEKTGIVKLTDFGFSNKFTPGTLLDTSCGSLAYSAPEILLGDSYDAPKVDIWSLGVILYMLVCGVLPFQEANDSETLTKIMDCHYTLPNFLSVNCCNLIRKMLCRDPEKRASLNEILTDSWVCDNDKDETTASATVAATADEDDGNDDDDDDDDNANYYNQQKMWMYENDDATTPLICQENLDYEEHMEILNLMSDGGVGTQAEIQNALDNNQYNHLTATYYLLAERKLRRRRVQYTNAIIDNCINNGTTDGGGVGGGGSSSLHSSSSKLDSSVATGNSGAASNLPPVASIRILGNDVNSGTPEDRLRRFSMILEDEEEKEEIEESEDDLDGEIIIEEESENEEEMETNNDEKKTNDVILPPTSGTGGGMLNNQLSVGSGRRLSRQSSISHYSSGHSRRSYHHNHPYTIELGEELHLDSEGVAVLRYASSIAAQSVSARTSRRRRRASFASFPYAEAEISLQSSPRIHKMNSTDGTTTTTTASTNPTAASLHHVSRRRSSTAYSALKVKQRRSLPSPLNYMNRRLLLGQSKTISTSYSNSSDNSDNESNPPDFIVPINTTSTTAATLSSPPLFTSSNSTSHTHTVSTTSQQQQQQHTMKSQSLPQRKRSNPINTTQSSSRSSSGSNLREHYAPIKEVDEISTNIINTSNNNDNNDNTATASASSVIPHPVSFHHSFSMGATPSSSSSTTGTSRSAQNVARHSVHGITAYKPVNASNINNVNNHHHHNSNNNHSHPHHSSSSSVSQSNFSLSSLASSLRDSKLMMEVIRGTFELQLHQQRHSRGGGGGTNSLSSSISHQDRLDQILEESQSLKTPTVLNGRSATHSGFMVNVHNQPPQQFDVVDGNATTTTTIATPSSTLSNGNAMECSKHDPITTTTTSSARNVLVELIQETDNDNRIQSHRPKLPFKIHCCVLS